MTQPHTTADQMDTDTLSRHRGPVTCAVVAPGERVGEGRIVSSGYDGAIGVADLTRTSMSLIGYHKHLVNRIRLSPDGRLAASSSSDYTVGIWDLGTLELVRFLHGHSDDVEDFVFVDESTGVSVSRDRRIIVWDLDSGAIRDVLLGHEKDVLSVAVANGRIYTSGDDMTLRVWDLETGQAVRCWGPFEHETDTCAIDVQRRRVVLGCDDGIVRIFDIANGRPAGEIDGHTSGVKVVAVSPSSGHIFSAAYDRRLVVWDADTLEERLTLQPTPSVWERSFNWSPDGETIVAGTFDGTVVGWDAHDGRQLFEIGAPGGNACLNEVAVVGNLAAVVADDGYLRLGVLSRRSARWVARQEPRDGRVLANAVAADEDAGLIVTGCHDQTVRVFTLDDRMAETRAVSLDAGPINSVKLLRADGGHHIVAACYSGEIVRLGVDGEILARFRVHDGAVKSVRLVPQRGLGISCSADGSTSSWSLETGERQMSFPAHTAIVNDLDVDPAGTRVATVGRDFVLNVYSLESGRLLQAFPLGRRSPKAVVFAADALVMVGDYWGHVIRVPLDGGGISRRRVAANGISSLSRRSDDEILASSYDGAIFLIDASSATVVNELRAMRQRPEGAATSAGRGAA